MRDALDARAHLQTAFLCPELLGDAAFGLRTSFADGAPNARLVTVDRSVMRLLADTETPQGVVAVATMPPAELPSLDARSSLLLILDGVRDPGNVGTLLRTAAAAGCDAVVSIAGSADPFAPKIVRAAMGAHFRLPVIADVTWDRLGPALGTLPAIFGTDGGGTLAYDAVDFRTGAAIIVGNEDHGLSEEARRWCVDTLAIPMARGVESLNAAISGSIILFEAVRQRRIADEH